MILKRKTAKTSETDEPADRPAADVRSLDSERNRSSSGDHKQADNNNQQSSKENGFVQKSRRTNSVDRANEIAGKEKKERQEQPDRP